MKIDAKVCLTQQTEVIAIVCERTGIASAIIMPDLKGVKEAMTWVHPLSYWANVKGLVKQDRKWVESLGKEILAGLFISCYEHFDLLQLGELKAVEANRIFQTAEQETLVELVYMARFFTEKGCKGVGALCIEWQDVKQFKDCNGLLKAYAKRIKPYFVQEEQDKGSRMDRLYSLTIEARAFSQGRRYSNGVVMLSGKETASLADREFNDNFRGWKKEAKNIASILLEQDKITAKQKATLDALCKDRNLVSMSAEVREQIRAKLSAIGSEEANRLAQIIKDCFNPYDLFSKPDVVELDRASDDFAPKKPKSIAEILAERKAKSAASAERSDNVASQNQQNQQRQSSATSYSEGYSPLAKNIEAEDELEEGDALDELEDLGSSAGIDSINPLYDL